MRFPEWDVLKELDRRSRRSKKRGRRSASVRKWMREHPEAVAEVREKHGM